MKAPKMKTIGGIGRVIDYMFGRNALIGIASLMLLVISGYATWSGMADFILGLQTTGAVAQGRQLPGGLAVSTEWMVIAIVTALTFLMWLALRETFGVDRRLRDRFITFPLYLFLALWSVGFGYGFWWSLIAGQEATRTSLSNLQEDARDAGGAIAARLDAVQIQLDSVVTWSESQMAREEASGGSCGKPSGAGRGPLYNARRSVRDAVASLRDNIKNAWLDPIKADLDTLRKTAARSGGVTVEERQRAFEKMAATVRGKAKTIAARSNELGKSIASEMEALAAVVSIQPDKPGFSCYDPTLASRLRQAAAQAGEPAVLRLREAEFNEGPAGVANAVKKLWANLGSYFASLPGLFYDSQPSKRTASGEPITGRDLIALLATLGVDLGLFALTALNPPRTPPAPPLTEALKSRIRRAISDAIARTPGASIEWIHRHLVHHGGTSYFVIPNLYRCGEELTEDELKKLTEAGKDPEKERENEKLKGLALNQVAGVLDDVKQIKALTTSELKKFRKEEARESLTDLSTIRHKWREKPTDGEGDTKGLRNHGLLSKARRALDIAGWRLEARADPEIFKLVDAEGLTPLLDVFIGADERDGKAAHATSASGTKAT